MQFWLVCINLFTPFAAYNQPEQESTKVLTLQQCIAYAMSHQPALKQSVIDESIAKTNNHIALSYWMPQLGLNGTLEHYYQLPYAFVPNSTTGQVTAVNSGLPNIFTPQANATQTLFTPDVLFAAQAAPLYNKQAKGNTTLTKISLISNVSTAFYDLLLTQEQITVLKEDTARLNKNKNDTYHQYIGGVVDKVDYKQATIQYNNATAQLITAEETLKPKYARLKQLIGYEQNKEFTVNFDTQQMMQDIYFDTSETLDYSKRIEYTLLENSKHLQKETTNYYKYSFLPSLGAFYNYNWLYESKQYSDLYNKVYPTSLIGVNFSFPIFQGGRRIENIHKSKLIEKRQDWDLTNLKMLINTEYQTAMANYKSSLYNFHTMQENKQNAREVYDIVNLQYREGIKTYLNVITAESDLRTSEINYLNALFQLLISKTDLQKAMGDITP